MSLTNSCKVSVLVPVFNVERYLRQCLDSLEMQTLEDIQIICIDDGSTDGSPRIIAEYCARDRRFEVITKPNSGYGDSMNQGLARARGEYVGILESDDFANTDMFEGLYRLAVEHDADVVKSNFFEHSRRDGRASDVIVNNLAFCPCDEVFDPRENHNIFLTQPAIWSALYKRSFLEENDVRFLPTPGASFQDTSFNFKAFAAARRVVLTDHAYLHYRTDNAASSVKQQSKVFPICDEYAEIWRFARADEQRWEALAHTIPVTQYGGYIWNLRRLSPEVQYGFYERFATAFRHMDEHGVLDLDRFDPLVRRDIAGMLADADGHFERTYGPIEVETTYLVRAQAGASARLESIARGIGEHAGTHDEIICIAPADDAQAERAVELLHERDRRFFTAASLFANACCERIDPKRLRGTRLIVCDAADAPADDTATADAAEALGGRLAHLEALMDGGGEGSSEAPRAALLACPDEGVDLAAYRTEALRALDVALLAPLLATAFYAQAWSDAVVEGAPLARPRIASPAVPHPHAPCTLADYLDAAAATMDLVMWPESALAAAGAPHDARKAAHAQLGGIWQRTRSLRAEVPYTQRSRAGAALATPDDALLVYGVGERAVRDGDVDVSVIVPVYNMERYLAECLDSVLAQRGCTLEVLCIDDGSSDSSLDLLEAYARRDERITVISQLNEGVAAARNRGIDVARGSYLAFIDPDDRYASDDVLATLVGAASRTENLLCGGSFTLFDEDTNDVQEVFHGDQAHYTFTEEGWRSFADDQNDYGWIRFVYDRRLFANGEARFPLLAHYEDPVFFAHIAAKTGGYYAMPTPVYRYRTGHKETAWTPARTADMLKGIEANMALALEHGFDALYTMLFVRLERDYYQPIVDNGGDGEVLEVLARIQAALRPEHVVWLRESDTPGYVLRALRGIAAAQSTAPAPGICAPAPPAPADPAASAPGPCAPPDVALVRAARKVGSSAAYQLMQRSIWRMKDVAHGRREIADAGAGGATYGANTAPNTFDGDAPLVSVIVPVYNCAPYLVQCLDSIAEQTYGNWELICVDDGSTDGSLDLLDAYAATHWRMSVIRQEHQGPARARNCGVDEARGAYLLFLDADDFDEPTLLEKAVAKAEAVEADVVIWDTWFFDNALGKRLSPPAGIVDAAPFANGSDVFSWRDNPDWILMSFQNWPWNKLYRTSFVRRHNLRFQEDVAQAEDAMFVCAALVQAERLAYVDERLSNYRVSRPDSAMSRKDAYPLDFLSALLRFRSYLIDQGLFDELETGYASWALSGASYNLLTLRTVEAFGQVRAALVGYGLEQMGVLAKHDDLLMPWLRDELDQIMGLTSDRYLFAHWRLSEDLRNHAEALARVAEPEPPAR